jgi:hypothetical protein
MAQGDLAGMEQWLSAAAEMPDLPDLDDYLDDLRQVKYLLGDVAGAIAVAQQQLAINTARPWQFFQTYSAYHRYLGDYTKAKMLTQQLTDSPARARDLSWHEFRWGSFEQAMAMQQHGRTAQGWSTVQPPDHVAPWQGQHCESLVILPEAGFGDQILYSRWIAKAKQLCANAYVWTQSNLDHCVARIFDIQLLRSWQDLSGPACYVPMIDLPSRVSADRPLNSIYFTVSAEWQRYTDVTLAKHGFRIGVCDSGDTRHPENHLRSIPLQDMAHHLRDLGELVYLGQDMPGHADVKRVDLEFWEHTLAVIHSCDVVVTVDTSIAHAAAALGKHTLIPTNKACYYCWPLSDSLSQSEWYHDAWSVTQPRLNDWITPLQIIREHIKNRR